MRHKYSLNRSETVCSEWCNIMFTRYSRMSWKAMGPQVVARNLKWSIMQSGDVGRPDEQRAKDSPTTDVPSDGIVVTVGWPQEPNSLTDNGPIKPTPIGVGSSLFRHITILDRLPQSVPKVSIVKQPGYLPFEKKKIRRRNDMICWNLGLLSLT